MTEYKMVNLRNTGPVESADLNVLAREGWRVVTCCHSAGQGIVVIMSREVQVPPPVAGEWRTPDTPLPRAGQFP